MGSVQDTASTNEFTFNKLSAPEHELLVAILDRAVLDFYSKRQALRDPAKEWLFEAEEGRELFSFDWICDHLNLEPQAVRKQVSQLKLSTTFAQSHRWLRRKVQSGSRASGENDDDSALAAA